MVYEQQHTMYLEHCNRALNTLAEQIMQNESIVSESALYSLFNGGKRVRGVLTLAVCDLLGGHIAAGAVFASALEMMHCFSLIHDDLPCMDNDDMRRGKPANHIKYGEATALLAGDLLAIQAFEVLTLAPVDTVFTAAATRVLARAAGARGMIYGQELDLKYETYPADESALLQIHKNKTGALLCAGAELGILAAQQQTEDYTDIITFAQNIGLVFQIVDDILDVTATQDQLGKPIGSDSNQGKTTFVTLFGLEQARTKAVTITNQAIEQLHTAYGEKALFLCEFARQLQNRIY